MCGTAKSVLLTINTMLPLLQFITSPTSPSTGLFNISSEIYILQLSPSYMYQRSVSIKCLCMFLCHYVYVL